ncbi:DUF2934 domain-containing protein [Devosia sp.]|jgi:hypothetical protein|uniref:DUF2934 domain-containing protein n=1 Tax=Devosia sp. TaxID=1871048 RepID=UPI001A05F978|nr:DUF2934 domain-containing protein [Devosia sp.]MBE0580368.1 DUF2934 domain-containing protein [Devosia sp.]
MHTLHETDIRTRAYALWESDGSPEGRALDYWLRAQRELSEETELDRSEEEAEVTQPTPPAGFPAH